MKKMGKIARGATRNLTDMERAAAMANEPDIRYAENETKSPVMNMVKKGREI